MIDESKTKKNGRPRKGQGPRLSYQELDRLLVMGEEVALEGTRGTAVVYPSYREIAHRFGVSHSLVSDYSKKHNCLGRRAVAETRVAERVAGKLVELRAQAIAVSRDDTVNIIDGFLTEFQRAVADGRVRSDNPSDFNLMVRLKEFILGGADARHEVHAGLTLEELQKRHSQMLAEVYEHQTRTEALSQRRRLNSEPDPGGQLKDENPPAASSSASPRK